LGAATRLVLWAEPVANKPPERTYRKLIEVAEETKAEAELCPV
jgi:hypothetical protein